MPQCLTLLNKTHRDGLKFPYSRIDQENTTFQQKVVLFFTTFLHATDHLGF